MYRFRSTVLLVLVLLASACSDSNSSSVGTLAVATAIPAATPEGEVVEGFAPDFDEGVAIIGVAAGETIDLRLRPGVDQFAIAEIPGDTVGLTGLGETFETPDGRTWWFVRWQDSQGWIEPGAAYLGAPNNVTAELDPALATASFNNMTQLAVQVSDHFAADSDEVVIVANKPNAASGTSVTIADVLSGEVGDSEIGSRLTVTATGSDGNLRVQSINEQPLCGRGVAEGGTCS